MSFRFKQTSGLKNCIGGFGDSGFTASVRNFKYKYPYAGNTCMQCLSESGKYPRSKVTAMDRDCSFLTDYFKRTQDPISGLTDAIFEMVNRK